MILDLVVIGILVASALVAFWRGFVREVLTIFSLLGAAVATYLFGPSVAPVTRGWLVDENAQTRQEFFGLIPYDVVGTGIGFVLVFVGVLLVFTFIAHWFSRALHAIGLGPVDRSLGVVFGLLRGVVLIGLMSVVLHFIVSEEKREDYFSDSKTYPYVAYMAELSEAMMPGKDAVSKDTLKELKRSVGPLEPGQKKAASGQSSGNAGVAPHVNTEAPAPAVTQTPAPARTGRLND